MGTIFLAIVLAIITSIIAPTVMSFLQFRQRQTEKEHDWARLDAVEARVKQADEISVKNLEANKEIAVSTHEMSGRLNQIHTLVNSNLTAALLGQLKATQAQLVLMKKGSVGKTEEEIEAIDIVQKQIDELQATLMDRAEQTRIGEEQLKNRKENV